jgi:energy-coupling factor transporter ATP-binding protein EcfA2
MLKRIYCDNYKCLVNFEFRPEPVQLLMGRNGAGKSTIFEVLELLRDFAARGERCEDRFAGDTRTRWLEVPKQQFELDVEGKEGTYAYKLVVEEAGLPTHARVHHESVTMDGAPLFLFEKGMIHLFNDQSIDKVQFPFDSRRSGLAIVEPRPENRKLIWLKEWLARLLYIQIDPKRMGPRADKEAVYPTYDLENFAEWYRHLRLERGAEMDALRKSLIEVIEGFESLDLKDAGLNTRVLQVAARVDGKPVQYSFSELSDGQRALVGLYALLHCSPGHESMLCIDEPDNFVALAEIQPWLSLLLDSQETGLQLLVASHHPELLNQLATRKGIVLDRLGGRQSRVKPFSSQDQTALTPAELVARGWENA